MKCKQCKYMEKSKLFTDLHGEPKRYCRLKMPPQVNTTINTQTTDNGGCSLGQKGKYKEGQI